MNSQDIEALCPGRKVADLGCGRNKLAGAVSIDYAGNSVADIKHDLDAYPYPVAADSFDVVLLRNVIEHAERGAVGLAVLAVVLLAWAAFLVRHRPRREDGDEE